MALQNILRPLASIITKIEHSGFDSRPIQIACETAGDVGFASCGETDHDDEVGKGDAAAAGAFGGFLVHDSRMANG